MKQTNSYNLSPQKKEKKERYQLRFEAKRVEIL
jgi:hypothetical protein